MLVAIFLLIRQYREGDTVRGNPTITNDCLSSWNPPEGADSAGFLSGVHNTSARCIYVINLELLVSSKAIPLRKLGKDRLAGWKLSVSAWRNIRDANRWKYDRSFSTVVKMTNCTDISGDNPGVAFSPCLAPVTDGLISIYEIRGVLWWWTKLPTFFLFLRTSVSNFVSFFLKNFRI